MAASGSRETPYFWYATIVQSFYLTFLIFVGRGIFIFIARASRRNPGGYLLSATMLYWLAAHFMFFGIGRFHFPLIPMLAGFAGLALIDFARQVPNRQSANAV
jgi:hypothetical protein